MVHESAYLYPTAASAATTSAPAASPTARRSLCGPPHRDSSRNSSPCSNRPACPQRLHPAVLTPTHSRINCIPRNLRHRSTCDSTAQLPIHELPAGHQAGCTPRGVYGSGFYAPLRTLYK